MKNDELRNNTLLNDVTDEIINNIIELRKQRNTYKEIINGQSG